MASYRSKIIGGTGAIVATVTGAAWAILGDDEKGAQQATEPTDGNGTVVSSPPKGPPAGNITRSNNTTTDGEEPEYPAAATPEANPEVETNDSVIADPGEIENTGPTKSDIEISGAQLTTDQRGATVRGNITNTSDTQITVELKIKILEDEQQLTYRLTETTGLPPGESWEFGVQARGAEYSEATGYDIKKSVSVATR